MRRSLIVLLTVLFAAFFSAVSMAQVNGHDYVVVIDAGHGGANFPGAKYEGVFEKNINLKVAKRVASLLEEQMPSLTVILTRTREMQFSSILTEDLQARADRANKAQGDLFISIHSNASRDRGVTGTETLVMGETKLEQNVNEEVLFANNKDEFFDMSNQKTAAVVRAYIQNLQYTYGEYSEMMARLVQKEYVKIGRKSRGVRRQPLKVLYATDMPSILTEIGFMSNHAELMYITSEQGQSEIARAIVNAIKNYFNYLKTSTLPAAQTSSDAPVVKNNQDPLPDKEEVVPVAESVPTVKPKSVSLESVHYEIQIMASVARVNMQKKDFADYRNDVHEVIGKGDLKYKYCVGVYPTAKEAQKDLPKVRKTFSGAFVVRVKGDNIY
ncbi:MAG: N-acetylmuramoyl-L-alanine amidase [Alistipes sp.]|nr:N-acetylmuramoyl-L-alanine amidase [Candidatus Alistipes equi]